MQKSTEINVVPPGRVRPTMCTNTNYIKFCAAIAINFAEAIVNDVEACYLRETRSRHCETILADNKKHVIVLTDQEILNLLELSEDSDITAINDFMDTKIRSLKFKSKK